MKRYIKASTEYLSGSYLVDRQGQLMPVKLHSPSTTYINRGLMFLSPTDADLLYRLNKISQHEVEIILTYNFDYFIEHEKQGVKSMLDISEFSNWAELNYAPNAKSIFMKSAYSDSRPANADIQFNKLNQKWYPWLQNNFVKLSVIGTVAEFRITSEDGHDWNNVIIDDVILSNDWKPRTKFNILKEDETGYRAYFFNATLDEILENDNVILSSDRIDRINVGEYL